MANILIAGAGAQGAPCAAILARQPGVGRVLLGTRELADAESVRDRIGNSKVLAAQFDGRHEHMPVFHEPETYELSAS